MSMRVIGSGLRLVLATVLFSGAAVAQTPGYPKPTDLPNPYRLVEGWPSVPKYMNGGHWGEVIRVHVDANGHAGSSIDASTWCRRDRPPAWAGARRTRRFWSSTLRANCSKVLARGCLLIRTVSQRMMMAICGLPMSMIRRRSSECRRETRRAC